jgi:hypothetical protein
MLHCLGQFDSLKNHADCLGAPYFLALLPPSEGNDRLVCKRLQVNTGWSAAKVFGRLQHDCKACAADVYVASVFDYGDGNPGTPGFSMLFGSGGFFSARNSGLPFFWYHSQNG